MSQVPKVKVQWSYVAIAALAATVAVSIVLVFLYQKSNSNANLNNTLYPFSAVISPGQSTVFLKNATGNPQIDCSSVGGKINIIGAWSETIDPYGTCTGTSADVLNLSCGIRSAKVPCKQDADCGSGMSCAAGMCTPASCPLTDTKGNFDSTKCSCGGSYCPIQPGTVCDPSNANSCNDPNNTVMQCLQSGASNTYTCQVNSGQNCMAPDPFTGKFCASYPLCSNADKSKGASTKNIINNVCSPYGKASCRPRDVSAYLAAKCDGKITCPLLFDPADPNSGFGPAPCNIRNESINQLPNTPGQGGNYSQGYYTHGLYTCIVPQ